MRRINAELINKNSLKFTQSCLHNNNSAPIAIAGGPGIHQQQQQQHQTGISSTLELTDNDEDFDDLALSEDYFGGIIKKGQLGWLARGPLFEVYSLKTGQKISSFRFDLNLGFERCIVTCVAEIDISELNFCILAICMQFNDAPGGVIVLCSVQELSKIFRCIEIKDKITSCHYIRKEITKRTILQMFNGCLAIGTDNGNILLLDLDLKKFEEALFSGENDEEDIDLVLCYIVESTSVFHHITQHHMLSKQENVHFGIQLDAIKDPSLILSIAPIVNILSLAVGLEDGRLILYDLSELQISYILNPPTSLPLVKLAYIEPADDPRACIYLWAFHEGQEPSTALMYSIMYEKRLIEDDGICLFENFQSCNLRLTLNTSEQGGVPIACQSIYKESNNDEDNTISICLLAWKQQNGLTQLLLFDMNQWYKEQMPNFGNSDGNESYLASFTLKDYSTLDMYINPNSVASFNSLHRPEEHFYPISLTFDCIALHQNGCSHLKWPGLQNRALELLKSGGALAILEPTPYFDEIIHASLLPQFCNRRKNSDYRRLSSQSQYSDDGIMDVTGILQNYNSTFSINDQRDILLSVALEYNCFGLLKECALCWADGSHLGRRPFEGLSLSTLTEWIWKRATAIKKRCNHLCIPLFDHSGVKIDQRSRKELSHLLRQLKSLSDLLDIILKKCREYIPNDVFEILSSQHQSIRVASEYQEIVHWLLNVGLLPEGIPISNDANDDLKQAIWSQTNLVPFPYKILKEFYSTKRKRLGQINKSSICSRTGSCRVLYIDAFIEHECNANELQDHWIECGGNGLYPPPSLQAMLRTMLIPDISLENKYVLFIYLFLDLNMAVECERHAAIVQNVIKFPAVFKLNASLIKTVQAFWNLDHGQFEIAIEELISPFSQDRKLSQWQKELLVETLLTQDQPNFALRALQIPSTPMSTLLELKTLLSNNLIAEAFHLQRTKNDSELFRHFLIGCLYLDKLSVLRDLAFNDNESKILENFLRNDAHTTKAENLNFVYLLQKSKYIDALSYLDELSNNKQQQLRNNNHKIDLETPNLILSAYNSTMTPSIKILSDIYYDIRKKIRPKDLTKINPLPLSSQLFKENANKLSGGIYHSSILGADQATIYWNDELYKQKNRLLDSNNAAFIRSPQIDIIPLEISGNGLYGDGSDICKDSVSYPEIYKNPKKRKLQNDTNEFYGNHDLTDIIENPQKRRRIIKTPTSVKKQNINTSLLTKFKDKSSLNQNHQDYNGTEKSTNNSISRQSSVNKAAISVSSNVLLHTPIVKSNRLNDLLRNDYDSGDEGRVCTPHSILKSKDRPSRTPAKLCVKRKLNIDEKGDYITDDERSIRFDLPKRQNSTSSSSSTQYRESPSISLSISPNKKKDFIENDKQDMEDNKNEIESVHDDNEIEYSTDLKDNTEQQYSMGPKKRKPLKRSLIEDLPLSTSLESEDYFSVYSSREVSKISEKDLIEDNDKRRENTSVLWGEMPKSYEEEQLLFYSSKTDFHSTNKNVDGPKPRRPLRTNEIYKSPIKEDQNITSLRTPPRNYRNRSRSKTPDPNLLLSARKSERLQNKQKSTTNTQIIESKSSLESVKQQQEDIQKPLQRQQQKPLSQMVLKANTMKNLATTTTSNTKTTTTTICKNIIGDTFVLKESEIIEKSDITFAPSTASSRIFESSTPICKQKIPSIDEISTSKIENVTTYQESMNISSEYSSVIEKSQEEEEEEEDEGEEEGTVLETVTVEQTVIETTKGTTVLTEDVNNTKIITANISGSSESGGSLTTTVEITGSTRTESSGEFDAYQSLKEDKFEIFQDTQESQVHNVKDEMISTVVQNDEVNDDDDDKVSISSSSSIESNLKIDNKESDVKNDEKIQNTADNDVEIVCISSDSQESYSKDISHGRNICYSDDSFESDDDIIGNYFDDNKSQDRYNLRIDDDDDNDNKDETGRRRKSSSPRKRTNETIEEKEEWLNDYYEEKPSVQNQLNELEVEQQQLNDIIYGDLEVGKEEEIQTMNEEQELPEHLLAVEEESEEHEKSIHLRIQPEEDEIMYDEKSKTVDDQEMIEINQEEITVEQLETENNVVQAVPSTSSNVTLKSSSPNETETKIIKSTLFDKITEPIPSTSKQAIDQVDFENKKEFITEKNQIYSEETPVKQKISRGRRARSESIDIELKGHTTATELRNSPIPSRLTRAKSVSTETPSLTPTRILTRRQSALLNCIEEDSILQQSPSRSTTPTTPNRILTRRQSALLDRIEEDSILQSSPALKRTKSLKRLDNMTDSGVERTPKRTRRSSICTDEVSSSNPSKSTRAKSVLSEDNYQTPKKNQTIRKSHQATPITEEFHLKVLERQKKDKKAKTLNAVDSDSDDDQEDDVEVEIEVEVEKEQKKRGRKSKNEKNISVVADEEMENVVATKTNRKKEKSVEPENKSSNLKRDGKDKEDVKEDKKATSKVKKAKSVEREIKSSQAEKSGDNDEIESNKSTKVTRRKKEKSTEPSKSTDKKLESIEEKNLDESNSSSEQMKNEKNKLKKSTKISNRRQSLDEPGKSTSTLSDDDYSSSRRLTRSQQAVVNVIRMQKMEIDSSVQNLQVPPSPVRKRTTKSEDKSIADSDVESIASTKSKRSISSKSGVRKQSKNSVKDDDETSSVGSSVSTQTTKKSTRTKSKNLKTIKEDEGDNDGAEDSVSQTSSRKRGLSKKK